MKVENLSKTYRTKGAPPVQALRGVSFTLPDTGMVFLLGRSGSGKSTLLHILSGLESFDAGDITYRGNRFADFSERDRDKYRNSCCGIIFQDYSLITELTVGENIALALRLQGERDTDERVKHALGQVGLSGCEHRRVTQLSGGQKQRVAIARALVKSPRILFADEPTGALDEQTGKDILMLLKALSKERLVFVVSHDRAFAETFGDRIIELADGQIVSDTAPAAQEEAPEPLPDLPARLPLGTALKLGCRNLLRHPVRLAFTLLLSVFSLILVGIPATVAMFNAEDAYVQALETTGLQETSVQRYERYYNPNILDQSLDQYLGVDRNYEERRLPVTAEDAAALQEVLGYPVAMAYSMSPGGIVSFQRNIANLDAVSAEWEHGDQTECFLIYPTAYVQVDAALLAHCGYTLQGRLPQTADEIALSMTAYRCFAVGGLLQGETTVAIHSPQELIGRTLEIGVLYYGYGEQSETAPRTITGIIDTNCDRACERTHPQENIHNVLYVGEGYLEQYNYLFLSIPADHATKAALVSYVFGADDGTQFLRFYNSTTSLNSDYSSSVDMYLMLSNLCLYVSAAFFVFSFLLLINFISASVRDKLQQMGILRALGTGFSETVKIYTGSAILLGLAIFALSAALMPLGLQLFNAFAGMYMTTDLFAVSLQAPPFLLILAIALLTAILGSLVVLAKYARHSPAEIIRMGQN